MRLDDHETFAVLVADGEQRGCPVVNTPVRVAFGCDATVLLIQVHSLWCLAPRTRLRSVMVAWDRAAQPRVHLVARRWRVDLDRTTRALFGVGTPDRTGAATPHGNCEDVPMRCMVTLTPKPGHDEAIGQHIAAEQERVATLR